MSLTFALQCLYRITQVEMEEADKLCHLLFKWLEKRRQSAEKLLALAEKLEKLHSDINTAKLAGNATTVAAFFAAALITIFTGGLAAPLAVGVSAVTVAGAAVSISADVAESIINSQEMAEAQTLIAEDEKMSEEIQKVLKRLHMKVGARTSGNRAASSFDDAEQCEVVTQLMWQIARRNKIKVPLKMLQSFNKNTFSQTKTAVIHPTTALSAARRGGAAAAAISSGLVKYSAKEVAKDLGCIGLKNATKGILKVFTVFSYSTKEYNVGNTLEYDP